MGKEIDKQKSKVIGLLHELDQDSGDIRLRSGDYASDRIRVIIAEVGQWPEKPIKKKKPVNVMRNKNKRFPFQDAFASRDKGFGHSRGK